jgi:hypothetical protein
MRQTLIFDRVRYERTVIRVVGWIAFAAVVAMIIFIIVVVATEDDPTRSGWDRSTQAAIALVSGGLLILLFWFAGRIAVGREPTLTIEPETLVIEHKPIFKEPMVIPRSAVRVVSLSDENQARWSFRSPRRFRVVPHSGTGQGWLYTPRMFRRPIFPFVTTRRWMPNLVVIFQTPVPLPRLTWEYRVGSWLDKRPRSARSGAYVNGLFLRVEDRQRVREILAEWCEVREVRVSDLPNDVIPSER